MMRGLAPVFIVLSLFLLTCKGKNEAIPSYIKVDSVTLSITGAQGNKINDLEAVFCYVDGDLLGLFELPATIPALYTGKHKISLIPAFFLNGSASQRSIYHAVLSADTTLTLTAGKISTFNNGVYKYRTNVQFPWTEDFEDANSSFTYSHLDAGDSAHIVTVPFNLKGRFGGNTKALEISLKGADTSKYIDLISFNSFSGLPVDGTPIYLDFDIKSPLSVEVALERISGTTSTYVPYLLLYETKGIWKHFYIDLQYEIAGQPSTNTYKIYFTIQKDGGYTSDSKIYLDNIRLCYQQ